MTEREKLIELIQNAVNGCARHWAEVIADHLLSNGVKVVIGLTEACGHPDPVGEPGESGCDGCIVVKALNDAKAESVKEFAERLKSKQRRVLDYDEAGFSAPTNIVYVETIDNLVKELTEGERDE